MRKRLPKLMLWFFLAFVLTYLIDLRLQGRVEPEELAAWLREGKSVTIVDVRSKAEYDAAHVPGAVHIPFPTAYFRRAQLKGVAQPVVVYSGHGPRASLARAGLRLGGIGDVLSLTGHYSAWSAAGLPTE